MRRTILGLLSLPMAVGLSVFAVPPASAAPIDCPDGQTATKVADGWQCFNKAGNDNQSEDPKNPNAGKDKF